ncbi:unnamed protein product [Fraxinus pennsylvanica]|uniref:Uncharacterized protein n=1 Tax=Fraxinus pennsylvanica TaxID=56036 RepID=A0AAD2A1C4_9LAMI|nr:unnamed protein product [Fraxinus pennsylvanica]
MNGSDEAVGSPVATALPREEQIRATEVSCTDSPERSTPVIDEICTHDHAKSKLSPDSQIAGDRSPCSNVVDGDSKYPECIEPVNLASMDLRTSADPRGDISEKSSEMKSSASLMLSIWAASIWDNSLNIVHSPLQGVLPCETSVSHFQSFSKALPSFTAILQCSNPSVCRFSLRYPSHGVCLAKAGLQVHI